MLYRIEFRVKNVDRDKVVKKFDSYEDAQNWIEAQFINNPDVLGSRTFAIDKVFTNEPK